MEKPNLWLKVAETSERNMIACLDRLGLTPNARGKVKPTHVPTAPQEATPEQQFLDGINKPGPAATELLEDLDIDGEVM
jgi:phage terminase small subunit